VKVLVIPEDPTYDQYILKPIVERLFRDLAKPARVQVLRDPRLGSVSQALNPTTLAQIIDKYPMIDLFLLLIDRDGDQQHRPEKAQALEDAFGRLFVCLAIEEVEVWMLALHRDALPAPWLEIRTEMHPKERFAEPFLSEYERRHGPSVGAGRKGAMRSLGSRWKGMLQVCSELRELKEKIAAWLERATA